MKTIHWVSILIIVALGISAYIGFMEPGKYDEFVSCLTEKGASFYGASWCEHCADQKRLFGKSANYLPYVECSAPDRKQTQFCKDEGIESYPTWKFSDGTKENGLLTLEQLSAKTGCEIIPK